MELLQKPFWTPSSPEPYTTVLGLGVSGFRSLGLGKSFTKSPRSVVSAEMHPRQLPPFLASHLEVAGCSGTFRVRNCARAQELLELGFKGSGFRVGFRVSGLGGRRDGLQANDVDPKRHEEPPVLSLNFSTVSPDTSRLAPYFTKETVKHIALTGLDNKSSMQHASGSGCGRFHDVLARTTGSLKF